MLRELKPGAKIDWPLRVVERTVKTIKKGPRQGKEFTALRLGDRTAALPGNDWGSPSSKMGIGTVLRVKGTYVDDPKWGPQINIDELRLADPDEYDLADLVELPARSAEELETELRELTAAIRDPFLRQVVEALIGPEGSMWPGFREAPAAKFIHEAHRHGLLEHSLRVARNARRIAMDENPSVVDLAIAGGLLHDIGKIEAYSLSEEGGDMIDLTAAEQLFGHIPLGYYRVRQAVERLVEGGAELPMAAQRLLHIVVSHHGSQEKGSPVPPATIEAAIVHAADSVAATMGSFTRVEKGLSPGQEWSSRDIGIGGRAYFPAEGEGS